MIQSDPRYAGGFVWEWCDHGLRKTDKNGVEYIGYGGDFGEKHHMENICMDGVVSYIREGHSALEELKAVFAPVHIEKSDDGKIRFRNRNSFLNLEECDFV